MMWRRWLQISFTLIALVVTPLHADNLPPLLCIPSYSTTYEVPKANLLVIPATGGNLRRTSLGGFPEVVAVRWSADHRSALVAPSVKQPMFLCRFNPIARTFGPRQDIAATLGNPGVHYQIHIDDFDWSRDGTHLVLANQQRLVIFDLKTGRKHLLYHTNAPRTTIDAVAWSPNGKRVAFCLPGRDPLGDDGVDFYEDLWVINADGSGLRRLGHGMGPSWSADGRHLVVVDGSYNGGPAVVSYGSADGRRRVLRKVEADIFGAVAYSPDGRYIAVLGPRVRLQVGGYETSLYLMDGAGRYVKTLADAQIEQIVYPPWLTW